MYQALHEENCTKKFSIKHVFSKYDQIYKKLWIQSHLLNKSLTDNFIFCAMKEKRKDNMIVNNIKISLKIEIKVGRV